MNSHIYVEISVNKHTFFSSSIEYMYCCYIVISNNIKQILFSENVVFIFVIKKNYYTYHTQVMDKLYTSYSPTDPVYKI